MKLAVKNYPRRGFRYTTAQVFQLDMDDTPSFGFMWNGKVQCVQDSHLTEKELLTVPGFADLEWTYLRTTHEWIPVFDIVDVQALLKCVDMEPHADENEAQRGFMWTTPKGFKREQFNLEAYYLKEVKV